MRKSLTPSDAAAGRICGASGEKAMPRGTTTATSKAAVGYENCNRLFALKLKWADLTPFQRESYAPNEGGAFT